MRKVRSISILGVGQYQKFCWSALARHKFYSLWKNIRVVATTPEKTHNQKFLTFETILNRFLVQFYPGFKKKEKKLPPLIYTVQVQYDDDHDDPTL